MNYLSKLGISAFTALMLVLSIGFATVATPQSAHALEGKITGNIGFSSQYVFRGSVENKDGMINGGFDYSHPSGAYAGYWTANLGEQSYPGAGAGDDNAATENDFYLGYAGTYNGIGYDVGFLQYVYANDDSLAPGTTNDANEVYLSLSKGPFSAGVTMTTKSAVWTEEDDLFYNASYSGNVIGDLGFTAKVTGNSLETGTGTVWGTSVDDGLSTYEVSLSHPLGNTGATASFSYIANDTENDFHSADNHVILGVSYGFDVAEGTLM